MEKSEWKPPTTLMEKKEELERHIKYATESIRMSQLFLKTYENQLEKINQEIEREKSGNPWG